MMARSLYISKKEIQWKIFFIIVGLLFMVVSLHRSSLLKIENTGGVFFDVLSLVLLFSILVFGFGLVYLNYRFAESDININLNTLSVSTINSILIVGSITSLSLFFWGIMRYGYLNEFLFISGGVISYFGVISLFEYTYLIKFPGLLFSYLKYFNKHIVFLILLGISIAISFYKYLYGDFFRLDDLLMIDEIKNIDNPLIFLLQPIEWQSQHYRPFFALQNWINYKLFGLNYFYYQLNLLIQHLISTVILYFGLHKLSENKLFAFLGSFIFSTSIFMSLLVVWVSDTMVFTKILLGLIFILIVRYVDRKLWYFGLFLLLFLIVLNRENGASIIAAVAFCSLYIIVSKFLSYKQVGKILSACIGAIILYLVLRGVGVGFIVPKVGGSTGYFFEYLGTAEQELLGYKLYAYTVIGNAISVFYPILGGEGVLEIARIIVVGFCSGATLFALILINNFYKNNILSDWLNYLSILSVFCISYYSYNLTTQSEIYELNVLVDNRLLISLALHSILSTIMIFTGIKTANMLSKKDLITGIFALGLMLFGSLIAFPYFRWRSLSIGMYGWIILLILCVKYLNAQKWGGVVTTSIFIVGISFAVFNGYIINYCGPSITIADAHILCDDRISLELALEISEYHDLDMNKIIECRK